MEGNTTKQDLSAPTSEYNMTTTYETDEEEFEDSHQLMNNEQDPESEEDPNTMSNRPSTMQSVTLGQGKE